MLNFMHKADVALKIHDSIFLLSAEEDGRTDAMKSILLLSGMLVETAFLFDNPEDALEASFDHLSGLLSCDPFEGPVRRVAMPPATVLDFDTEQGRALAREVFEDWLDCGYEFHETMMFLIQQHFVRWEQYGQARTESLRLLIECTYRAMAYELAAQELCDAVIERKIGLDGWSIGDGIAGVAGLSGRKLALSHEGRDQCCWFQGAQLPDFLDQTAYVMTQEAVRLGLNSSTDWRFGLPANDVPANPPYDLIKGIEGICAGFFNAIEMNDYGDQAVSCAKAAGRLLAVAAGGEKPQMEPAIAKPLAMAALTESYKSMCVDDIAAYI
ncbi:MAG: hypothetical protein J0L77_05215 [Alphaproteobacteria bacterium]|nr:hypothetical protein [Alphaproteobacteria bacterium]